MTLVELVVAFNNLSGLGSVHNSEKLGVRGVSYKSKCRASASALCNAYVIKRDVAAVGFLRIQTDRTLSQAGTNASVGISEIFHRGTLWQVKTHRNVSGVDGFKSEIAVRQVFLKFLDLFSNVNNCQIGSIIRIYNVLQEIFVFAAFFL